MTKHKKQIDYDGVAISVVMKLAVTYQVASVEVAAGLMLAAINSAASVDPPEVAKVLRMIAGHIETGREMPTPDVWSALMKIRDEYKARKVTPN
jgi:hypothetical protein